MERLELPEYDEFLISSEDIEFNDITVFIDTFNLGRKVTIAYGFLIDEDNLLGAYGYSVCNPEDRFVKSLGEAIALGRFFLREGNGLDITVAFAPSDIIEAIKVDFIEGAIDRIHEGIDQLERVEFMHFLTTASADLATQKRKDKIVKEQFPPLQ